MYNVHLKFFPFQCLKTIRAKFFDMFYNIIQKHFVALQRY